MTNFSFRKRIKSFNYAYQGLKYFIQSQHNAWIHAFLTLLVIALAIFFKIERSEWVEIILCIGLVFFSEIINTAIEEIVNFISPEYSLAAKLIKDLAAGAVLISAIIAAIVGFIIFLPYLT